MNKGCSLYYLNFDWKFRCNSAGSGPGIAEAGAPAFGEASRRNES